MLEIRQLIGYKKQVVCQSQGDLKAEVTMKGSQNKISHYKKIIM
jgi:hypothetical protein